jgi:hypothetical protein
VHAAPLVHRPCAKKWQGSFPDMAESVDEQKTRTWRSRSCHELASRSRKKQKLTILALVKFDQLKKVPTQGPSKSKVIFGRFRQLLAINAHEMAPRTTQWLQERHCDTPTKGLLWCPGVCDQKSMWIRCHMPD